jgi:hypothetical protein
LAAVAGFAPAVTHILLLFCVRPLSGCVSIHAAPP